MWTSTLKVGNAAVGEVNEFYFDGEDVTRMEITELEPGRKLVWRCIASDPEWVGTGVSYSLKRHCEEGVGIPLQRRRFL